MNNKHKTIWTTQNYIECFLILASAVPGSVSISDFVSSLGIHIGIMSSAKGSKTCAVTSGTKKYRSAKKKKQKKHVK